MLIAGDIGVTKTDLAIYSGESGSPKPLAQADVHSAGCDVKTAHSAADGRIAIVAPDTGLGESFLTSNGSQCLEGGHRVLPQLTAQILIRRGRFKDLLERMPIHITTTRAAVAGAATFGLQSLGKLTNPAEAKTSLAPV